MKKYFLLAGLGFIAINLSAQTPGKTSGQLHFNQGQPVNIELQVKSTIAQQAMGQSIDINVNATGNHSYQVTNSTEDNHTLHHALQRVRFSFDGMGQKMNFDSNEEKDLNGRFGKPIKDLLGKTYDIVVDPKGTVLMALPEKVVLAESDARMAIITNMLRDVIDLVQPPQKGKPSFFKVLPDKEVGKGDTWTSSESDSIHKLETAYVISEINDSTIVIDFVSSGISVSKAEFAGNETTTTMNNKSTGKIYLDKATGILKEKTIETESTGTTEASFGSIPVNSKTSTKIIVKPN